VSTQPLGKGLAASSDGSVAGGHAIAHRNGRIIITWTAARAPRTSGKTEDQWRQRYFVALRRLRQAGIRTIGHEQAGVEIFISLRAQWDRFIGAHSAFMAYQMREIDPASVGPQQSDQRQEFRTRLRPAG
jgi:hypothetical protein